MAISTKKIARKAQIQAKAVSLFSEKGYNASSMRHLAENMGMEAASLYNHINSKQDLLHEICFSIAAAFVKQLDELEKSNQTEVEKVEQIIRFHIQMMLEQFEKMYVSNRDWKHLKEPYLSAYVGERRNYEKRFSAIIEKGIEKQLFAERNTYVTVLTILSAVRGIEFWHKSKKRISAGELENELTSLLMAGIINTRQVPI
ncbi:MAG: TetR/AcrR family transcriptional regulator [Bacteroidota bacterium]